jgi:UDP-galactopyranose mutase
MRWFLQRQIAMFAKIAGLRRPIIIVTVPTFAKVALALNHESVIYYRSDRHSAFVGADSGMIRANEDLLFENADAVLYSNERLFETERGRLDGRAHLIGHGIDTSLFSPEGPLAPELSHLPRPRVGFFGDLRARSVDFPLVAETAALRPNVQFVLGGTQLDDLGCLGNLANVHIVPACEHDQMPARWRSLDAAILPYQRTAWQEASEPIKLNEIFAVGLRAVGTPLPALQRRPDCVELADGPTEFAHALDKVLQVPCGDLCSRNKVRAGHAFTSWETISATVEALSARRLR